MNLDTVYELMRRFEESSLSQFSLETEEFSLSLGKAAAAPAVPAVQPAAPKPAAVETAAPVPSGEEIKSPLVGTFYKAAAPDAAPYVAVGQTVKKGETVCLVEAMKMMNEIPAPCDCVIEAALVEDGALVEFDQPLFSIRAK